MIDHAKLNTLMDDDADGMSTTDLADRLCINRSTVHRWRHGEGLQVAPEVIQMIANALGVQPADIMNTAAYGLPATKGDANNGQK